MNLKSDSDRSVLFIDGGSFWRSLEKMGRKLFGDLAPNPDWSNICGDHDRVFFYDALPSKSQSQTQADFDAERQEKVRLHDELALIDNFHVREGLTRSRRKGAIQQKGVDILLALEAYQQATSGNMDRASFILTDLDFFPLFDALLSTRCKTRLFYDPLSTSSDLIACADTAVAMTGTDYFKWFQYEQIPNFLEYKAKNITIQALQGGLGYEIKEIEKIPHRVKIYFKKNGQTYQVRFDAAEHVIQSKSIFLALEQCELSLGLHRGALNNSCQLPPIASDEALGSFLK